MAIPDHIIWRVFEIGFVAACVAPLAVHHDRQRDRIALEPVVSIRQTRVVASASEQVSPIVCRNPIQDIGLVMGGAPVHADYVLENLTDQPVWFRIIESCSCCPANTIRCIEPLGTTVVRVQAQTRYIRGAFTKTVQIKEIDEPINAMELLTRAAALSIGAN